MKEDKKRAKLAALFPGLEEHLPTEPTPDFVQEQQTTSREAEAVMAYVHRSHEFKRVACKWCEGVFAVDRANVAYCRDECRAKALAEIGIVWDPRKPQDERWDYREPLTVRPQALVVADLAVEVLAQQEPEVFESTADGTLVSVESPNPIVFDL
jgi:hypothetical protein